MKNITSTSFGLFIAFVLPGLAGFYSLSFWMPAVDQIFKTFLTVESNVGLFLLVLAAAVIMGLQITLVRWIVFEYWICRSFHLDQSYFESLGIEEERLMAYRAVVDAHYRYHQFWGGMTVVIPIFIIGWMVKNWANMSILQIGATVIGLVLIELLTGWAATVAFKLFSMRAKKILDPGG